MRPEATQQDLIRLSMTQLIEHGRQAIRVHDYERAASLFREGLRRAPLRQDLKEGLGTAIEGLVITGKSPRKPIFRDFQTASPPIPSQAPPDPPEESFTSPKQQFFEQGQELPQKSILLEYQLKRSEPIPPRFSQIPEQKVRPAAPPAQPEAFREADQRDRQEPEDYEKPLTEIYKETITNRFASRISKTKAQEANSAPQEHGSDEESFKPTQTRRVSRSREQERDQPEWPEELQRPIIQGAAPPSLPYSQLDPKLAPPALPEKPSPPEWPEAPPAPRSRPANRSPSKPASSLYPASLPPRAAQSHPGEFARRHQRGPLSAMLSGGLAGLLLIGLGVGLYFLYAKYAANDHDAPGLISQGKFRNVVESANLYRQRREYSRAREQLLTLPPSTERDKLLAEVSNEIGDEMFMQDKPEGANYEGATEAYKEALAYDAKNAKYGNNLGEAYFRLGNARSANRREAEHYWKLARQSHEAVLMNDPNNIKALSGLEAIAIQQGDDILLAKSWRRMIEAAPDSPDAREARRKMQSRGFRL